jgi:hypothetical protein
VGALRDQLDTFWARALAGYTEVAEEGKGKRKKDKKRKRL